MSVISLTPEQQDLVSKAALQCGFNNFDIEVKIGSCKGDNYLGIIHSITVQDSSSDKKLHFILKSAHVNAILRNEVIPVIYAFQREVLLYSEVFPKLMAFQEEQAISQPFTGIAKYYGSNLLEFKESILMGNLKEEGYDLWNRMEPMEDEHITMVFKEYARFHASSLGLKYKKPEEFAELTKNLQENIFEKGGKREKFYESIRTYFVTGLEAVESSVKATEALLKLQKNIGTYFMDIGKQDNRNFVVIHGDCWCNNILFKYEKNSKAPSKVAFVDWQLSKLSSLTLDLVYFFCVNGSSNTYKNMQKYLETYHQVLSQNLREYGVDSDEVYSFEQFESEFRANIWYGVFMAMMVMKIMLASSEEAPDISQAASDGKNFLECFTTYEISKSNEFNKRLIDLVEFMVDNEYL